jgi:hypothetical protein
MKLILASSLGLLLSVSSWAQRGSAAGHAGHASIGFSSGRSFAAPTSPNFGSSRSFGSTQVYRPNFATHQQGSQYSSPIGPPPFGGTQRNPGRRNPYPGNGYRPNYYSRGVYAVPGWLGGGFYDNGYSTDSSDQQTAPAEGYAEQAPPDTGGDQAYGPIPPRPEYRSDYQPSAASSPDLQEQPQVTLVFKDGRPQQVVQNYAVTRTTLYVLDGGRRREIPLEQLDLPSTEKTNRAAGVDFEVPMS